MDTSSDNSLLAIERSGATEFGGGGAAGSKRIKRQTKKRPRRSPGSHPDSSGAETRSTEYSKTTRTVKKIKLSTKSESDDSGESTEDYSSVITKAKSSVENPTMPNAKSDSGDDSNSESARATISDKKPGLTHIRTDTCDEQSTEDYSSVPAAAVSDSGKNLCTSSPTNSKSPTGEKESDEVLTKDYLAAAKSQPRSTKAKGSSVTENPSKEAKPLSQKADSDDGQTTEDYLSVLPKSQPLTSVKAISSQTPKSPVVSNDHVRRRRSPSATTNVKARKRSGCADSDSDMTDEDSLVLVNARKQSMLRDMAKRGEVEEKEGTSEENTAEVHERKKRSDTNVEKSDGKSIDHRSHGAAKRNEELSHSLAEKSRQATKKPDVEDDSTDDSASSTVEAKPAASSVKKRKVEATEEKEATEDYSLASAKSKSVASKDKSARDSTKTLSEEPSSRAKTDDLSFNNSSKTVKAVTGSEDESTDDYSLTSISKTKKAKSGDVLPVSVKAKPSKMVTQKSETDSDATKDYSQPSVKTKLEDEPHVSDDESTDDFSLAKMKLKITESRESSNNPKKKAKVATKKTEANDDDSTEDYSRSPVKPQPKSNKTKRKPTEKRQNSDDESADDCSLASIKFKKRVKSGDSRPDTVKAKPSRGASKKAVAKKVETDDDTTDDYSSQPSIRAVTKNGSTKMKSVAKHRNIDDESTDDNVKTKLKLDLSDSQGSSSEPTKAKVPTKKTKTDDDCSLAALKAKTKPKTKLKFAAKSQDTDEESTDDCTQTSAKTKLKSNLTRTKPSISDDESTDDCSRSSVKRNSAPSHIGPAKRKGKKKETSESEISDHDSDRATKSATRRAHDSDSASDDSDNSRDASRKGASEQDQSQGSDTDDKENGAASDRGTTKSKSSSSGGGYNIRNDKRLHMIKRYITAAGLRVPYTIVLKGIKTHAGRKRKLEGVLQDAGLKGKPTLESCKRLRRKRERRKEAAELDLGNILDSSKGRSRRGGVVVVQKHVSPNKETKKIFSRLKAIAGSDDSSD